MSTIANEDPQESANRMVPKSLAIFNNVSESSSSMAMTQECTRTTDYNRADSFAQNWFNGNCLTAEITYHAMIVKILQKERLLLCFTHMHIEVEWILILKLRKEYLNNYFLKRIAPSLFDLFLMSSDWNCGQCM